MDIINILNDIINGYHKYNKLVLLMIMQILFDERG